MKKLLFAITLSILVFGLYAAGWQVDSDINLTLSQSAYSDSWQGTELNNITWMASSNSSFQKQMNHWLHIRNTLKMAFGQTHLQKTDSQGNKYWADPEKTTDKFDLESLWRLTLQAWVDPYIAGRIESQFLDLSQEDDDNTRYLNPSLLTESTGVIHTFIENDATMFNARLGVAYRLNINRDQIDNLGNKETLFTRDGGLELVSEFQQHINAPLKSTFRSRVQVFQALLNDESDDLPNNDWKSPDMVWENSLSTKLFGLVSANLLYEMRYEKEQIHKVQWKQMLGLGISYTLF